MHKRGLQDSKGMLYYKCKEGKRDKHNDKKTKLTKRNGKRLDGIIRIPNNSQR